MGRRNPRRTGVRQVLALSGGRLCIGCPAWCKGENLACRDCWESLPERFRVPLRGRPEAARPSDIAAAAEFLARGALARAGLGDDR